MSVETKSLIVALVITIIFIMCMAIFAKPEVQSPEVKDCRCLCGAFSPQIEEHSLNSL